MDRRDSLDQESGGAFVNIWTYINQSNMCLEMVISFIIHTHTHPSYGLRTKPGCQKGQPATCSNLSHLSTHTLRPNGKSANGLTELGLSLRSHWAPVFRFEQWDYGKAQHVQNQSLGLSSWQRLLLTGLQGMVAVVRGVCR